MTAEDLRYPVGRFEPPTAWDPHAAAAALAEIARFPERLRVAVAGLDDGQLDTPYRDGGWTVRQVVHHAADSHLNAYCRFRLALTEPEPVIKPYDEARWAELSDARTLPLAPSFAILDGVHARWVRLVEGFRTADFERTFIHPEHGTTFTLWRTLAMYAWHCRHHVAHITALRAREGW